MATANVRRKRAGSVERGRNVMAERGRGDQVGHRDLFHDAAYRWRVEPRQRAGSRLRLSWWMDEDPYVALMAVTALREELLEAFAVLLVEELRNDGYTWDELAMPLGMTREGARQKFGPLLERRA